MIDELRWPSRQGRRRTARITMQYKIRHEMVCMNNMTEITACCSSTKKRPHLPIILCNQDASHNANNSPFYHEQSKTGTTYSADLPFKSDRIVNLLIAVALTEEEEVLSYNVLWGETTTEQTESDDKFILLCWRLEAIFYCVLPSCRYEGHTLCFAI